MHDDKKDDGRDLQHDDALDAVSPQDKPAGDPIADAEHANATTGPATEALGGAAVGGEEQAEIVGEAADPITTSRR